eukprot:497960-Rhodomonas_salina.1
MQQGDSDVAALQTSAAADLSPVERYYKQRFEELEAKLNKFEQRSGSGSSKRGGGDRDRGDRGKRDRAGARSGSQDSNERDGKSKTPPKCDNPKCVSGGKHFGKCFAERDFEKEREKLAADEKKFRELKKRRDEKHVRMATSLSDPSSDDDSDSADSFSSKADSKRCFRVTAYDPDNPPPDVLILHAAHFDLNTAERGFCLDSASQTVLTNSKAAAKLLGTFKRVRGAHGASKSAEDAAIAIATVTTDGQPVLLTGFPSGLYMEDAHGNLLPLAPLVRAGIQPCFKVGTDTSPRDGGYLRLPDGRRIQLLFEKEMWYLPTWQNASGKIKGKAPTMQHITVSQNVYDVLDAETEELDEEPALPFTDGNESGIEDPILRESRERGDILLKQLHDRVELEIRKWCHPGPTKRSEILDFYPHLFPASRDFRRLFLEHVSPVDALMKGHRRYRKVARKKKLKAVKARERIAR